MVSKKLHTAGRWYYEPADPGDSSVGINPTPPQIVADAMADGDQFQTMVIATLQDPFYTVPREEWTDLERKAASHPEFDTSDFPPGARFSGSAEANGERIALMEKFFAGYDNGEIEALGVTLAQLFQAHADEVRILRDNEKQALDAYQQSLIQILDVIRKQQKGLP